jgi:hypothetical protein
MTCRLYYSEPSAAMEVCAILEEIGAPYELVWTNISSPTWHDPALLRHRDRSTEVTACSLRLAAPSPYRRRSAGNAGS